MNKASIQYISWDYGRVRTRFGMETVHLIRLTNGQGLLRTSAEMVKLGLAKYC